MQEKGKHDFYIYEVFSVCAVKERDKFWIITELRFQNKNNGTYILRSFFQTLIYCKLVPAIKMVASIIY